MTVQSPYVGKARPIRGLEWLASGKVRDIYALDADHLLFVTSDRVSAFDVVMAEAIPYKGAILTHLSAWWFEQTRDIVENHFVSSTVDDVPGLDGEERDRLRGRVMIVRRAAPTTVEWVVRGHLAGSGWKEYQRSQSVCGVPLPAGLDLASPLPEPVLTPTTKDEEHDLPLTPDQARERVGDELFGEAESAALALFARGSEQLAPHGIVLADTKFEFGVRDGRLLLIDELLTPDSSRFWPRDEIRLGESPPSYDKQILRDHLETLDWNKQPPPPALDAAILDRTSARYRELCLRVTGSLPDGMPE